MLFQLKKLPEIINLTRLLKSFWILYIDQIIVYNTFYSKLTFYIIKDSCQGLLWLPKSRSQKNRQAPFLKVRSQFRSQLRFLQGANFFEPKQWMIACTTTSFMFSFMYKWSRFVCTNVNVCIVVLYFCFSFRFHHQKQKDLYNLLQYTVFYGLSGIQPGF